MIELINILYAYWEQNELKLYTTKGLEVIKALADQQRYLNQFQNYFERLSWCWLNPQKLCNEIPGQEVDTYLFEFKNDTSFSFNLDDGKLAAVTVFTYSPSYSGGNFTYGTDEEDFIILTELCNQLGDVVAFEQYAERPGEQILVIDSEPG